MQRSPGSFSHSTDVFCPLGWRRSWQFHCVFMKYLSIFIFLPVAFIPWLAPPRGHKIIVNFPILHFLRTPQQAWVTCSWLSQLLWPGWARLSPGHMLHPRAQWSWLSLKSLGCKWAVWILKKKLGHLDKRKKGCWGRSGKVCYILT